MDVWYISMPLLARPALFSATPGGMAVGDHIANKASGVVLRAWYVP